MNKKKNELYKSNEKTIIDLFIKLLEEKDISKITVREICTLAKINRTTFYNHFIDIYDVLDAVFLQHTKNIMTLLGKKRSTNYRTNLKIILTYIQENQLFYRVSFQTSTINQLKKGFEDVLKFHEMNYEHLTQTQKEITDYQIQFLEAGFFSTISFWLEQDCNLDIDYLIDILDPFYNILKWQSQ